MLARVSILAYGFVSYMIFLASFVYLVGFIGNTAVPISIDDGPSIDVRAAIGIDLLLISLFALQHTIMARAGFKRASRKILPEAMERSTYVLFSSLLLFFLFWQWRPVPIVLWHVDGLPGMILTAICWLGWLIVLASTYMIDHAHLFGMRQVADIALRSNTVRHEFRTPLLYRVVRHPLMLGFLIAFWFTPHMTVGHMVFAAAMTGYILLGLHFEERDLRTEFGDQYLRYQKQVPKLLPRIGRRSVSGPAIRDAGPQTPST